MKNTRIFREYRPGDRKKYFRNKGLATDGWRAEIEDGKAKRCAAVSKLQALLGLGSVKMQGQHCWITYPAPLAGQASARIAELRAKGQLIVCKTGTGAVCLGSNWARVMVGGVVIEVMAQDECPACAV